MSTMAERYANATEQAWDRKMRQEAADEKRAQDRRDDLAGRPHTYRPDELILGFCVCGHRKVGHP